MNSRIHTSTAVGGRKAALAFIYVTIVLEHPRLPAWLRPRETPVRRQPKIRKPLGSLPSADARVER